MIQPRPHVGRSFGRMAPEVAYHSFEQGCLRAHRGQGWIETTLDMGGDRNGSQRCLVEEQRVDLLGVGR